MVTIASNAGSVSATVRTRAITAVIHCRPFAAYALQVLLRLSTTVIVMLLATFILIAVDRSRSSQQGVLAESLGHNRSYQIFQVGYQAKLKTRCQPRDTSTCFGAVTQMSARATDLRYELRC